MVQLGQTGRDIVTKFEGVVIGRAEYLTGCTQLLLVPARLSAEGKRMDGEWFDEQRIERVGTDALSLENGRTPGADREAPKR